ncbi:transmembrane protein 53 [Benincasa hispida]|uniref:transmembrane protein 53 n=1 Tax=Benincasa hispida TaxID=102211 RepID=UPI001900CFF3|nr:transmembrane protein 53 [Benincasa hispida]
MEAPVRAFRPCVLNRRLFSKTIPSSRLVSSPESDRSAIFRQSSTYFHLSPSRKYLGSKISLSLNLSHCSSSSFGSSASSLGSSPSNFLSSLPSLQSFGSQFASDYSNSVLSDSNGSAWTWNRASESAIGNDLGVLGAEKGTVTVVLLGWLGSKTKHLRRYVEWYNARGINALTFVVDPREFLWFALSRKVEQRISDLAVELISWLSDGEESDNDRCLIFHAFSNTGWFVYGAILEILQGRKDLLKKIKGCIFDSGGGDPLNPQVWAAGFSAAILKKNSSSASPMVNGEEVDKRPLLLETIVLSSLEKFFSVALKLPDVDKRLNNIVSVLTENQPSYPELYLYSSGDKVVLSESIELLIEKRKKTGRKVLSYNFRTSPHVDHYRTYPDIYASQLHKFLIESFSS